MPLDNLQQVPFKPIDFLSRDVRTERRADGTVVLQSNHVRSVIFQAMLLKRWKFMNSHIVKSVINYLIGKMHGIV